jgi:hypothetical protein
VLQYRKERVKKMSSAELSREGIIGNRSRLRDCLELMSEAASTDVTVTRLDGDGSAMKNVLKRMLERYDDPPMNLSAASCEEFTRRD